MSTHDHVTATTHDAEKWQRAHGPENDGDLHELRNEGRESDFRMEAGARHNGPVMAAFYRTYGGPPDCPGCGTRCDKCDERMCLKYGPAPIYNNDPLICERCAA